MELCSMLCANLDGMGAWGRRDTHTCMAESPHCSPKRITTLLIGNTPVQNVFGKKKENILKKKKKEVIEEIVKHLELNNIKTLYFKMCRYT